MRITVWGAGAIGGTLGAGLSAAGEDVLLVDTVSSHVEAVNEKGILIDPGTGGETVRVRATLPEALGPPLPLVLLAVKAHHTRPAVETIRPLLAGDGVVISLQNGLNEEVIAEAIGPERTLGALVNFSADYIAPGHILYGGKGALVVGELDGRITPRIEGFRALFEKAMPCGVTRNLWGLKWSKACYGSLLVATALVDEPVADIVLRSVPVQEALVGLVCELMDVASKHGIAIEPFDEFHPEAFRKARGGGRVALTEAMEPIARHYRTQTKGKTGVWRDLAVKKRKTEIDDLLGRLVLKGDRAGLGCPRNRRLIELIHEIEEGRRSMQWENLEDLTKVCHA
jgi:2-dehydropantoate 2-reductase